MPSEVSSARRQHSVSGADSLGVAVTADTLQGPAVASRVAGLDAVYEAIHGSGPVRIVNHWATWCSGCVEELPLLVELSGRLDAEVEILGVSWDGFQDLVGRNGWVEAVEQCSLEHGLSWGSVIVDAEPSDFFERLAMDCQTVPQVWVVNQEGQVVHRIEEPIDRRLMEQILDWVSEL